MYSICMIVSLFLLRVEFISADSDCRCCSCDRNETKQASKMLRGFSGKRGPPGPPGDVLQCGCNTSEILKQLQNLTKQVNSYKESEALRSDLPRSCKQIADGKPPARRNGIYKLQDSFGDEYSTYCDMEIDGGGWTLVATIHDNNPFETGRCTLGDKWSSETGRSTKLPKGDKNWENKNTFGQVKLATFDDFKNPAYFELQSKDVMMWQVPNGTPLRNFSSLAYLKYRTNNEFLTQYGGNLQRLYSEHFPITSKAYYFPGDRGPSVPVVFEKGGADSLKQHLSPSLLSDGAEAGYIQFRPIDRYRDAYAMCPGFRMITPGNYPGQGCLGSTAYNQNARSCGDTTSYFEGNAAYKTGWTADQLLVHTTYFIFYR